RADGAAVARALRETVAAWPAPLTGVGLVPADHDAYEVTVPPSLDGGHETHFARVLDEFLRIVDDHRWPTALTERTLAKYTLLAEAAAKTGAGAATPSAKGGLR
ncbi:MAG: putative oxidoreductase C-terminal domain-containing protein, partial [Candidatus Rokuibacteriota bacterium]